MREIHSLLWYEQRCVHDVLLDLWHKDSHDLFWVSSLGALKRKRLSHFHDVFLVQRHGHVHDMLSLRVSKTSHTPTTSAISSATCVTGTRFLVVSTRVTTGRTRSKSRSTSKFAATTSQQAEEHPALQTTPLPTPPPCNDVEGRDKIPISNTQLFEPEGMV